MNKILGTTSLVALGLCSATFGCGASLGSQLVGQWQSQTCESAGTVYVKRDFTLGSGTWNLTATVYTDAACTSPYAAIAAAGSFQIGSPSASVMGATEVNYSFSSRQATPLSSAALSAMSQGGCGSGTWTQGQSGDISGTGCAALGVPSDAACPTEMDLNQTSGTTLYFGNRSGNLCQMRPSSLGPPLQRVQ